MIAFREWLIEEERSLVDPSVLDSYEQAFQQRLEGLIRQTKTLRLAASLRVDAGLSDQKHGRALQSFRRLHHGGADEAGLPSSI